MRLCPLGAGEDGEGLGVGGHHAGVGAPASVQGVHHINGGILHAPPLTTQKIQETQESSFSLQIFCK